MEVSAHILLLMKVTNQSNSLKIKKLEMWSLKYCTNIIKISCCSVSL